MGGGVSVSAGWSGWVGCGSGNRNRMGVGTFVVGGCAYKEVVGRCTNQQIREFGRTEAYFPQLGEVECVRGDDAQLAEGGEMRLDGEEEMVVQEAVGAEHAAGHVQCVQLRGGGSDEVAEEDVVCSLVLLRFGVFVPGC